MSLTAAKFLGSVGVIIVAASWSGAQEALASLKAPKIPAGLGEPPRASAIDRPRLTSLGTVVRVDGGSLEIAVEWKCRAMGAGLQDVAAAQGILALEINADPDEKTGEYPDALAYLIKLNAAAGRTTLRLQGAGDPAHLTVTASVANYAQVIGGAVGFETPRPNTGTKLIDPTDLGEGPYGIGPTCEIAKKCCPSARCLATVAIPKTINTLRIDCDSALVLIRTRVVEALR